ncbi:hypothetical protein MRB53_010820 [Persea americana]|uniref:Uncharacterized protein n=1 Tax=Persea americana TaxID=3435 RepID=A0ACC2LTN0_PERAE|nr:hypothetical protein MRB53_010820 [Persea americana]
MAEPTTLDARLSQLDSGTIQVPPPPLAMVRPPNRGGSIVLNKALASAATLVKLIPSSTVFAFHTLSPSFSNSGLCYTSNKYLTALLIVLCSISCCFFAFTDTITSSNGKVYYGVATTKGIYVFNNYCSGNGGHGDNDDGGGGDDGLKDLKRYRIRWMDYIHAIFSLIVFMTIAFGDPEVMICFYPKAGPDQKTLLVNLRLGAVFLSSVVFLILPTSRKGIGYLDMAPPHP